MYDDYPEIPGATKAAPFTQRDYFAMHIAAGLMAAQNSFTGSWDHDYTGFADAAYRFADALMERRKA